MGHFGGQSGEAVQGASGRGGEGGGRGTPMKQPANQRRPFVLVCHVFSPAWQLKFDWIASVRERSSLARVIKGVRARLGLCSSAHLEWVDGA